MAGGLLTSSSLDKSLLSDDAETLRITQTKEGQQLVQRCLDAIEERSKQFQAKGMTKFNFVFGVSNSLMVAWSFGALPGYFWIVYLIEVFVLLPIRWNNMIKRRPKEHLYWLDFCWCANFVGVILLMALLFKDIDVSVQKWAFCAAWGLGNGPLLCAIAVLGNSLLFHDFDNTSSVLIHLFPSLVMYEMGWNREDVREAFPSIFTYHFFNDIRLWQDIYYNSAVSYLFWMFLYAGWLLTIGMTSPHRGYDTIFHHTMRGAGGQVVSKILKFSREEHKEFVNTNNFPRSYAIWYLIIHAVLVLGSIVVGLLCFANKKIHICLCGAMVLITIYNASSRYTFYMVSSYGQAIRKELNIPLKRGASALIERETSPTVAQ